MRQRFTTTVFACVLGLAAPAGAQTPEERTAARELMGKHGDAVITVLGSAKVRITQGGREMQNRDQRIQATATVLDAAGLAVMSLSVLDPGDLMAANLANSGQGRPLGAPAVGVTTEASDLRFRLANGQEVPARVVLRDKDLDLAFLRPVEPPASPMAYLNSPTAKVAAIDLLVVIQRLPEIANWQTAALFGSVLAVVDKPRTYYMVNSFALGAPMFDTRGRFVGVGVRLRPDSGVGPGGAPASIVLPADDIRDVAKQASGK